MKWPRFILITLILTGLGLLLNYTLNGTNFTLVTVSDSLFIVGILIAAPSVVAFTNAGQIFQGTSYALRVLFSKKFHDDFPKFINYKEFKGEAKKNLFFLELFFAGLLVSGIALVIALVSMYGL